MSEEHKYIFTQLTPNKIEEGDFWISDGWVYVQARRGKLGNAKQRLEEGQDARRVAQRLLRELVQEGGDSSFWDPINYKKPGIV